MIILERFIFLQGNTYWNVSDYFSTI